MKKVLLAVAVFAANNVMAATVTFITLTGAGSLSDTAIRQAAPTIERVTGDSVVVVNMPGANGLLGIRAFLNSAPDSKTYLVGNSSISYLKALGDITEDIPPIAGLSYTELAIFTSTTVPDLAALRMKPRARAGVASPMTRITTAQFATAANVSTEMVGYKQFSAVLTDLAANRIDFCVAPVAAAVVQSFVSSGKIHRVYPLGYAFGWNAVFRHPNHKNPSLDSRIIDAIRQTQFKGIAPLALDSAGVVATQAEEYAAITAVTNQQKQP